MPSHSKSCTKYKNEKCRYPFGKFLTDHTIVSLLLPADLREQLKNNILNKREHFLSKVKQYIDSNHAPWRRSILNPLKDNFEESPSIGNILTEPDITEKEYYNALGISIDIDFQRRIKCQPNVCFVNNYFAKNLQAWVWIYK